MTHECPRGAPEALVIYAHPVQKWKINSELPGMGHVILSGFGPERKSKQLSCVYMCVHTVCVCVCVCVCVREYTQGVGGRKGNGKLVSYPQIYARNSDLDALLESCIRYYF